MPQSLNNKSSLDTKAVLILTVLCASWGLQQVAIKVAIEGISPLTQAAIRSIGSSIMVLVWMWLTKKSIFGKDGTLWWGIAAGTLFAGEFLLIFLGLVYTNASRAVVFLYMSPFVVALGSHFFVPQGKLKKNQVLGLGCAFLGIIIAFQNSINLPAKTMLIGDAMLVGAAVMWGATTVLIKATPLSNISSSKTLLYQLATSAVILPLAAIVIDEPGIKSLSSIIVLSLLYQTIWVAFITYLVWFWLIRRYPLSEIASFTFLTPLFGVMAGVLLLDEPLPQSLFYALILVTGGIYLVNKPNKGKKILRDSISEL